MDNTKMKEMFVYSMISLDIGSINLSLLKNIADIS